jgi:hypothetical protein
VHHASKVESQYFIGKRRLEAVLTVDYVNEANSEASFQGRSSSMRLMG